MSIKPTIIGRAVGWKQIANVLGMDERACRRLPRAPEQPGGLPVYTLNDAEERPRVVADVLDLKRWLDERKRIGFRKGRKAG